LLQKQNGDKCGVLLGYTVLCVFFIDVSYKSFLVARPMSKIARDPSQVENYVRSQQIDHKARTFPLALQVSKVKQSYLVTYTQLYIYARHLGANSL